MNTQRQIKFRIWDTISRLWLNQDDIVLNLNGELGEWEGGRDSYLQETVILQQFTGLQDSTGKDIYEGDILQFHKGQPYQSEYEVYWCGCGFSLISAKRDGDKYGVFTKSLVNLCPADKPVIIGNRFDNPELV